MEQPYPTPEAVKTTKRCKFSLPGKRYDCRRIGKYVLNGKGYCALHYDAAWKFQNPEIGQQHEWHIHVNRFTGESYPYPTCRICGAIKVYDGLPQCLCSGKMPVITLR